MKSNKVKALATACCVLVGLSAEAQGADDDRDHGRDGRPVIMVQGLPAGIINPFAGENAPPGWLLCNGQAVSRQEYVDLYQVIGRIYTPQNIDQNHFSVPDLRGRVTVGIDSGAGRVTSINTIGTSGGEENVTLAINHIPIHDHTLKCSPQTCLGGPYPGDIIVPHGAPGATQDRRTGNSGGGQPHNNMQPYICLNYIINTGRMDLSEVEVQVQRRIADRYF